FRPDERLSFQTRQGIEAPFVESLGRKGADAGRQSPGFRQKDTAVSRHGLMSLEQVLQRREARAVRMRALLWLFQLLGISQKHQGFCRLGSGQDVRETHLARLI